MLGNILLSFVVLALAMVFAVFARRAWRAPRSWPRMIGGLFGALFSLACVAIAFFSAKGIAAVLSPDVPPPPSLTIAGTPGQVARGDYLVNLSCIGCHSGVGANDMPTEQHPLSGGWNIAKSEGFGFVGDLVAENLTPGGKLATYSDGELFRAIRHRVDKDGHLLAFMSLLPFGQLSDDDITAIIAYLRTLPSTTQTVPTGDRLGFVGAVMFGAGMFGTPEKVVEPVAALTPAITAEYGRYVATFGECRGCHGPEVTGTPASAAGPAVPNPRPLVATLSADQFIAMMRSGVRPNGAPFPQTMPWKNAARMTDDDLRALYAYLTAAVQ